MSRARTGVIARRRDPIHALAPMQHRPAPARRLTLLRDQPLRPRGDYVLYWMTAARRAAHNFALDHALHHAHALDRPLLVLEPLRCGYRWASDRHHRFILDGMAANARAFAASPVHYHPYVEPTPGAGAGLLTALAARAAVVVTDAFPGFFYPRMQASAAAQIDARLERVDGCGLLPIAAADAVFTTAHAFRRFLQRALPEHLGDWPNPAPLQAPLALPRLAEAPAPLRAWSAAAAALLQGDRAELAALPIDHSVPPAPLHGGPEAGQERLDAFLDASLPRYAEARSQPEQDVASGLSPYLHFGHVGAHQAVAALLERERWDPSRLGPVTGSRAGWWGLSAPAESFLDELITWREVGYNMAARRPDHDQYESLPAWAQATLAAHQDDPREHRYDLPTFAAAGTHDPLWNAAQRQLLGEGRIHNYLRMLWGKKILEWSASPREALATMIELNNRYALDGRDPNSYSGIFWVMGRYDRPWGPERPVIGLLRPMSSDNTARKFKVRGYIAQHSAQPALFP